MGAPAPSPARRKRDKCLVKQKDTKTTLKNLYIIPLSPNGKETLKTKTKGDLKEALGFLQQRAVEFPVWPDLGIKCSAFGTFSVVKITIMICSSAQIIKAKFTMHR